MSPADGTVRAGLTKWAARSGLEIDWRASIDYPLVSAINVRGHSLAAISHVMTLLGTAKVPLSWRLEGNKLVVEG
jgi:hypothetical protein